MNIHKKAALAFTTFIAAVAIMAPVTASQITAPASSVTPAHTVSQSASPAHTEFWPTRCEEDQPCWDPATMGNHKGTLPASQPTTSPAQAEGVAPASQPATPAQTPAQPAPATNTQPPAASPSEAPTAAQPAQPAQIILPAQGCNGDGIMTTSGRCMSAAEYDALQVKPAPATQPAPQPAKVTTPAKPATCPAGKVMAEDHSCVSSDFWADAPAKVATPPASPGAKMGGVYWEAVAEFTARHQDLSPAQLRETFTKTYLGSTTTPAQYGLNTVALPSAQFPGYFHMFRNDDGVPTARCLVLRADGSPVCPPVA